jgi:hypothetical protein
MVPHSGSFKKPTLGIRFPTIIFGIFQQASDTAHFDCKAVLQYKLVYYPSSYNYHHKL